MTVTAVIGAQWGDEGKGKIVDMLAQEANMVVRYNGGNNAGHTVHNELGEFKLHIVPAGIFNPNTVCIIGAGPVVHISTLLEEIRELSRSNISCSNLLISKKAHMVMPWHTVIDEAQEAWRKQSDKIGTTKRGMGPVFSDKADRSGFRVGDLLNIDEFHKKFVQVYKEKNAILRNLYGHEGLSESADVSFSRFMGEAERIIEFITHTEPVIWDAIRRNENVLLEGAQGVLLGLDHGTYPFVTSSNGGAAAAAEGSGVPPSKIDEVIGVVKAYTTRIGPGPFPTRAAPDVDEALRVAGNEYGATTGRPRMCGWIDLPLLRYASQLNAFTSIAITKLDVLSDFPLINVGIGYDKNGNEDGGLSHNPFDGLEGAKAQYEILPGWEMDVSNVRSMDNLPVEAIGYIKLIEDAAECSAKFVSVGPQRDQTIFR